MFPTVFQECLAAFRRNRVPALVLQLVAGFVLVLYFLVPATRPVFSEIADFRARNGYLFSTLSTAFFGGFLSWMVLWKRGRIPAGQFWRQGLFFILFWAAQGIMVDTLYRLQSQWFGDGNDLRTLLAKVLVDQGPYNMLYATPVSMIFYNWKDAGFSWRRAREILRGQVARRYWSIMVGAWMVWVPAVLMIYSLPPDLQIPLFNLVLCFFTLVLALLSRGTSPPCANHKTLDANPEKVSHQPPKDKSGPS